MWTRGDGHGTRFVDRFPGGRGLVGRDGELAALRDALSRHRLVTVTGAVGTGKSSLARTALAPPRHDPGRTIVHVRWHDGVPVGRRALAGRVARSLNPGGPPPDPTDTDVTAVTRALPPGEVLLFLDDVDPVHTECVGLVQALLMALPTLRILVTARRPLGLGDEKVVRLGPLRFEAVRAELPPRPAGTRRTEEAPGREAGTEAVRVVRARGDGARAEGTRAEGLRADGPRVEAVSAEGPRAEGVQAAAGARSTPAAELLLSRARERGWTGEAPDPAAVARVCRLLEGVPLALELAAARLGEWTMDELAARIEADQCGLADPAPLLRRHRSLRTAVGAVHSLCGPAARGVWRRAGVFAGPFTEAAAVFVCAGSGLAPHEVPPALAVLSAAGVLQVLGDPGGVSRPRYRMARSARDFAAERLAAAGELAVTRDRHAVHFRGVAAVAETLWNTGLQRQALQTVQDEHDDLMALVRRGAAQAESGPTGADPTGVDHSGVDRSGVGPTGAGHFGADRAGSDPSRADGDAMDPTGMDPTGTGQAETALETALHLWFWWAVHDHAAEGSAHLRALLPPLPSDSVLVAQGRWLAAWLCTAPDPRTAHDLLSLAWPVAVLHGDDALIGRIAHVHGTLAWERRDPEAAAAYYRQAADTVPDGAPGGPPPMVSLAALAVVQAHRDPAAAARTARRALAQPNGRNDAWATALAHYARALADHQAGRAARARRRALRALADLESRLDAPHARSALRHLLTTLDPRTPPPGTPVPAPRSPARPMGGPLPWFTVRTAVPTPFDQVE
ncbi:AAA family ATPase [Streptomyces sp. NPDC093089]|uniref:AAA family ATPase n=1 Tax=Streptomyces sp. NPDC093089 TaxID=3366024 RepID=UPI003807B6EE